MMKVRRRVPTVHCLMVCAVLMAGCGGSDDSGAGADSGTCGTFDNPGILKLTNRSPAIGASVVNRDIVHSFTVVNAPADYYSFDLLHGEGHSAGLSTPDNPRFRTARSGNNISYQLTIDSWSSAPGHVVLSARRSFSTSQGCTWAFPSPLFSYDVTPAPAPDGGAANDAKQPLDAGAEKAEVASIDVFGGSPDVALIIDLASETMPPFDGEVDAAGGAYDSMLELDAGAELVDANIGIDGI
jgi:hypothetical protein